MSSSSQPQFRYTQTPSKVLHLRNLPWECIEEELVELCKPFGKIVNTKCNVGANRNQAFVEFVSAAVLFRLFNSVLFQFSACLVLQKLGSGKILENLNYCLKVYDQFIQVLFYLIGRVNKHSYILQADLNQAISMVSYYASSSEPAQVRGKTVYIQYSNRHEIVNNKSPGDVPGNVLLVTIEGVEAGDVSIDVIHLVSAFYLLVITSGFA